MITVSICMIVKNEEKVLERCLSSIADLGEELVIVDTGSTDRTKEIAARYTDRIYDFTWVGDFSKARNFAFSKATCDYIYTADADEMLDAENRERFRELKESLLPEIEIVQMYYCNQLKYKTVYNYDREYRPKLMKRLRSFCWKDPIHETIRTEPVIFDSDIEIWHEPEENHAARDLAAFRRMTERGLPLSRRLHNMYARELFLAGEQADFHSAAAFFHESLMDAGRSEDELKEAACVAARAARYAGDTEGFNKYAMKAVCLGSCAEICMELGDYYYGKQDYEEAAVWYYNAAYETESILDRSSSLSSPLKGLASCCTAQGLTPQAAEYERLAKEREGQYK